MKTLPDGLQDHLNSGATTLAWCWRILRTDGSVFGFTDHDRDIAFDGTPFEAASGFTGTEIQQSIGLSVDNLDATGALQSDMLNEADLAGGLFDDARIEIWRVNWAQTDQRILMMSGSIGEVKRSETAFTAELRSLAHYLAQEQGRIYQYACDADLGNAQCGLNLDAPEYKAGGAVVSASSDYHFTASGLGHFADSWCSGGLLSWTSGENAGRQMEVKRFINSGEAVEIELWRSMASPIAPGDGFDITVGCDKTFPTCKAKFGNQINFRGFPHIPGNSYLFAYPAPGDADHDGSSMNA